MNLFAGYKTYIIAISMFLSAVAQMAGVDIPGFDGQAAGHLMMEAFALLFLRKGLKSDISNA